MSQKPNENHCSFKHFSAYRLLALKASKKHRNRVLAENTVFLRLDLASCGRGRGPLGPPGAPPEAQKSHFSKTLCFTKFFENHIFFCLFAARRALDSPKTRNLAKILCFYDRIWPRPVPGTLPKGCPGGGNGLLPRPSFLVLAVLGPSSSIVGRLGPSCCFLGGPFFSPGKRRETGQNRQSKPNRPEREPQPGARAPIKATEGTERGGGR